jgi:hypothetical protein
MKHEYLEKFSKTEQIFLYKLFSVEGQTDRQTDRWTDIMYLISQFQYAIKYSLHLYIRPAKFQALLQTEQQIIHYCLSGQQRYTRDPLAETKELRSESPNFKYHAEIHSFWISL